MVDGIGRPSAPRAPAARLNTSPSSVATLFDLPAPIVGEIGNLLGPADAIALHRAANPRVGPQLLPELATALASPYKALVLHAHHPFRDLKDGRIDTLPQKTVDLVRALLPDQQPPVYGEIVQHVGELAGDERGYALIAFMKCAPNKATLMRALYADREKLDTRDMSAPVRHDVVHVLAHAMPTILDVLPYALPIIGPDGIPERLLRSGEAATAAARARGDTQIAHAETVREMIDVHLKKPVLAAQTRTLSDLTLRAYYEPFSDNAYALKAHRDLLRRMCAVNAFSRLTLESHAAAISYQAGRQTDRVLTEIHCVLAECILRAPDLAGHIPRRMAMALLNATPDAGGTIHDAHVARLVDILRRDSRCPGALRDALTDSLVSGLVGEPPVAADMAPYWAAALDVLQAPQRSLAVKLRAVRSILSAVNEGVLQRQNAPEIVSTIRKVLADVRPQTCTSVEHSVFENSLLDYERAVLLGRFPDLNVEQRVILIRQLLNRPDMAPGDRSWLAVGMLPTLSVMVREPRLLQGVTAELVSKMAERGFDGLRGPDAMLQLLALSPHVERTTRQAIVDRALTMVHTRRVSLTMCKLARKIVALADDAALTLTERCSLREQIEDCVRTLQVRPPLRAIFAAVAPPRVTRRTRKSHHD